MTVDGERFSEGDALPEELVSEDGDGEPIRFAVPVDVYAGYGGQLHVYPSERVADESDLFADATAEELSDDVNTYTVPYEELR